MRMQAYDWNGKLTKSCTVTAGMKMPNGATMLKSMEVVRYVPSKGEGPQRKHYITNILITLDGEMAHTVSDYLVVRESEHGLMACMGGTYRDTFVKRDGTWHFARKELRHDIVGDMALKNGR